MNVEEGGGWRERGESPQVDLFPGGKGIKGPRAWQFSTNPY